MTAGRYVCAKCGGGQVEVIAARPSIDDRYAVGYCACTPAPVAGDPKKPARERTRVTLVRKDVFRPESIAEQREAARRRRLLTKLVNGTLSKAEEAEAYAVQRELLERMP